MAICSCFTPLLPSNGVISALICLCYFSLHIKALFGNLSAKLWVGFGFFVFCLFGWLVLVLVFLFSEQLIMIGINVEMHQGNWPDPGYSFTLTQHSVK